jgi:hypothetical protein
LGLLQFWDELRESGHPIVERGSPDDKDGLGAMVASADAAQRLELAYDTPQIVPAVTEWAITCLYQACQFLVYRDIEPEVISQAFNQPMPAASNVENCYSADLALCVLPELVKHARRLSEDDPLVSGLLRLAETWPLSSVGITGLGALNIDAFIGHPCLRRLYADRIILARDGSRLADPRAAAAVREAVGTYTDLMPGIATNEVAG